MSNAEATPESHIPRRTSRLCASVPLWFFVFALFTGPSQTTIAAPPPSPATQPAAYRPTVYAWFPARFGTWKTAGIRWDLITHICYRNVELQADGFLHEPLGPPADPAIREFAQTAHRHGVKVTVLVWTRSRQASDGYLANAPQQAADNLLAYVKKHGLDGVNIDDERMGEKNEAAGKPNRELVTAFFRTLARTFKAANPAYHISYAAPPVISPQDRFATAWPDYGAIAEVVDAIIPMGYTMNPPTIGWATNPEPLAGGGKTAGTTTRDLATMTADYLKAMNGKAMNAKKEKLLVGVSLEYGGNEWRCRTDQPLSPIIGKATRRTLAECEAAAKQHGRRWSAEQASAWYAYKDGDAFVQGWYNDAEAWQTKMRWVREQGLGGVGVWVLDGEKDLPERWQALEALIGKPAHP
jgi:chitinase